MGCRREEDSKYIGSKQKGSNPDLHNLSKSENFFILLGMLADLPREDVAFIRERSRSRKRRS